MKPSARVAWYSVLIFFFAAFFAPLGAVEGLQPGEYACAGAGGTILIGLGFKLFANGTYTDLDGKSSGRVVLSGSEIRFVGGHLDGQTGRNARNGANFEIGAISCSLNR